jgi:hypothetical protein
MNIFVSDTCYRKSAIALDDKRLIKMILETAQILSTVLRARGFDDGLYKSTHTSHPCTIWAGASSANFLWLCLHGTALAREYQFRFGKVHASLKIISFCRDALTSILWECGKLTPFANCTPYKAMNTISAYRYYLSNDKWNAETKWTKRGCPSWHKA